MGTMQIVNPTTGQVIREVETDTAATIADKLARAKAAQRAWAARPLDERLAIIARFRDLVAERREGLARTLTSEVGKPIRQSNNEINGVRGRIEFFLANTAQTIADRTVGEGATAEVISSEPLGVVANVSAWNYPWFVGSNVFVPALLTGNAVLYKPSEFSTLTGLAIEALLHEAGVPRDVFATVVGGGDVGKALVEADVAGVFFTGSYATGKRIAEACAGRMIKVQLELGGKDPTYVADDVDAKAAAESLADGAFYNNGQSCCSVERIYVHERIHDAFVDAFVESVKGFVIGSPDDEATYIGAMTRAAQLDVLDEQVRDAIARGAKLHVGGKRIARAGNWYEPTVFSNADNSMALMREESFGPIIGIARVSGDDEAVRLMNDTPYGLTAGVYTRDLARARKLLAQVNAGTAYVNCCDRVSPALPWTGRGHSGIGSTLGVLGIQAFVQPKAWHLRGALSEQGGGALARRPRGCSHGLLTTSTSPAPHRLPFGG